MKKKRRASTIMDIIIALLFVSTVLYFCYLLATSAINKRQQVNLEREAMTIAENIMNRTLSKGTYMLTSEPALTDSQLNEIDRISNDSNLTLAQKTAQIVNVGGRLKVDTNLDAPFLALSDNYRNGFSYQVIVSDYKFKTGVDESNNPVLAKTSGMKKIVVNVFYPTKVARYLNSEKDKQDTINTDEISLEEEYRLVTLTTYKAAREYEIY